MTRTLFAGPIICCLAVTALAADADAWPRWRGPFENGMARGDAPLTWSDKEHIAWKTAIPGRGHSTPVVWGDRIFLTTSVPTGKAPEAPAAAPPPPSAAGPGERPAGGPPPGPPGEERRRGFPGGGGGPQDAPPGAGPGERPAGGPPPGPPGEGRRRGGFPGSGGGPQAEQKLMVMAFDRKTGKQLWEKVARVATPHEGFHQRYGSFASHSAVVDGKHVITFFGSRGLYCYTHDGELVWEKDLGIQLRMIMSFGEGVSPALDGDTLVVLFDQEGDSLLVALDKNTGRELWRTPRPRGSAWATPLIITVNGKKQVLIAATKFAAGYDLENGKLIWQATGLGRNSIPMPVAADGMAFFMTGYQQPNLMAIQLGREGDLTGTDAIVWQNQKGNSYTPSPVLYEGKLYVLTDNGMLSCFDAKTGKPFYAQTRLPKTYSFKASPVGANGKLYLATENGDVVVVKMGETFEVLATNTLEDQSFISSPVIVDGEIFLRGQNTLFCIR